jgi:hypothetical protein
VDFPDRPYGSIKRSRSNIRESRRQQGSKA